MVNVIQQEDFKSAKSTTAFFEYNMTKILNSLQNTSLLELSQFASYATVAILLTKQQKYVNAQYPNLVNDLKNWRHGANVNTQFELLNSQNEKLNVSLNIDKHSNILFLMSSPVAIDDNLSDYGQTSTNQFTDISNKIVVYSSILKETTVRDSLTWELSLGINNHRTSGTVSIHKNLTSKSDIVDVWIDGQSGSLKTHYQFNILHQNKTSSSSDFKKPLILSPMPGKVVKIMILEGTQVKKGDTIAVLEAMKMEHLVSYRSYCTSIEVTIMFSTGYCTI